MKDVAISVNATLASTTNAPHIYPPTYAPEKKNSSTHNYVGLDEKTGVAEAVLVDSVGSFANRMEEQLAQLGILPDISIKIGNRSLSIHELPHRAYDAILRDSELDGVTWRNSEIGKKVLSSDMRNATALYQYAPLTLLLGGWDSHGGDAGHGTKIARSVSCEIWGYDVRTASHLTQRIDPLGIKKDEQKHSLKEGVLTPDNKGKKPSELGHGDVPSSAEKGVFVGRIEFTGAISLTRLNRYQFPDEEGTITEQRNVAAREVLKQLALLGISLTLDSLDLRSGCELYTTERAFSLISSDGTIEAYTPPSDTTALLNAIEIAEAQGLKFAESLQLHAGKALAGLASKGLV